MNLIQLLLGQIPEAIYCALFMITCKNIKDKRFLFTLLMTISYLIFKYMFIFNSYFQFIYLFSTYFILKFLYPKNSRIFDIFYMVLCYIFIIIVGLISFLMLGNNMIIANIFNKILLFIMLFAMKNKLSKLDELYLNHWNVNKSKKKKIKAITFRSFNVITLNIVIAIINIGIIISLLLNK